MLIGLLVVGGCTAAAVTVGMRFMGTMTAPVDVANEFLDAMRAGDDASSLTCAGAVEPIPPIEASDGQSLTSVNISNNRVATVDGTIDVDGDRRSISFRLNRQGDVWCVADLSVGW